MSSKPKSAEMVPGPGFRVRMKFERLRTHNDRMAKYVAKVKHGIFSNDCVGAQLYGNYCIIHDCRRPLVPQDASISLSSQPRE